MVCESIINHKTHCIPIDKNNGGKTEVDCLRKNISVYIRDNLCKLACL
jgi:hypothetical protein